MNSISLLQSPQPRRSKPIPPLRPLSFLFASLMLFCGPNLHAQTAPTITVQPASQTNVAGTTATFTVAAAGTGPFTYEWRLNGTNLPNSLITTVAGGGSGLGDGGLATNAALGNPQALTLDAFGNLYCADQSNDRIRKVDTNGVITTVAGNGSVGFSGDGGQATNATLSNPQGMAFDASGNLYFSDQSNNRIRKVDTNGIITTVAGNGSQDFTGDGGPATNAPLSSPQGIVFDDLGNLYFADLNHHRIRRVDTNGIITTFAGNGDYAYAGDGGPATNASLFWPHGLARDAFGRLFIGDWHNWCIRMVDTNGIITTVAGNGTRGSSGDGGAATAANLEDPWDVAVDIEGNLHVADTGAQRIRKVDTNGIINTVVGNGTAGYAGDGGFATDASLNGPWSPAFDSQGNLYIADSGNNRVRKVWFAGCPFWSIPNMSPTNAGDYSVVVSNPYGSVTSQVATLAVVFAPTLTVQPVSQTVLGGSSPALSVTAGGTEPLSYAWYFSGNNAVQTGTNNTLTLPDVSSLNAGGYFVVVTNAYASVTSQVATLTVVPTFITAQPTGQSVLVGTSPSLSVGVAGGLGPLWFLWYFNATNLLRVGTDSLLALTNVSLLDTGGYTVVITNAYASMTSSVATLAVGLPPAVTLQPANQTNLAGTSVTFTVAASGTGPFTYQWCYNNANLPVPITTLAGTGVAGYSGDGGQATNAALNSPRGMAFDSIGNLYFADSLNDRVRKVDTNGAITTLVGLYHPDGMATDAVGNLYVGGGGNTVLKIVVANGMTTTAAGSGVVGFSGDGGPATNANFWLPSGLALDMEGNLFISDQNNHRVRRVDINGIVTSVAGTGTGMWDGGYSGDGGVATNARLNYPYGLAWDASGSLYIADRDNCRIRKVDTNDIITTVAGIRSSGYSGDGAAATNAQLNSPNGVAFDSYGNLYITDSGNNRIRKVDANGIIGTVAGNGTSGFFGDGSAAVDASLNSPSGVAFDSSGNLYVADRNNHRIRKVHFAGDPFWSVANVSVTNAGRYSVVVSSPYGSTTSAVATLTVAVPPVITSQPVSQSALAGTSPGFSVGVTGPGPFSYAWYFAGTNLLQSGTNNSLTLVNVAMTDAGVYSVVVANNDASVTSRLATLTVLPALITAQPADQFAAVGGSTSLTVAVAGSGPFGYLWYHGTNLVQASTNSTLAIPTVSLADTGKYMVVVTNSYGSATSQLATLSAGYPPTITAQPANQTNQPGTSRTFTVTAGGNGPFTYQWRFNGTNLPNSPPVIFTVAGTSGSGLPGDGGQATNAALHYPQGIAIDFFGNLYLTDQSSNRIRRVDVSGIITTVAGKGSRGFSGDGGQANNAALNNPQGMTFDTSGNLYFSDQSSNRIRKVDTFGIITTVAGNGSTGFSGDGGQATNAALNSPQGMTFDASGNLYFSDQSNHRIRKVDTNGIITTFAGNGSPGYSGDGSFATNRSLSSPRGLARDASGRLYIGDWGNSRVRMVNTNGIITTVAGNGTSGSSGDGGVATGANLSRPWGVAVDAAGNLYIADYQGQRVRRVDTNGIITTLAGNGSAGYAGDGGSPTNAVLNAPCSLALDAQGNLYIADSANNRVRQVHFAGYPSWSVTNVSVTNAGGYSVVISSPYGCITSAVATLTVPAPPVIVSQPASQFAAVGTSPKFSVDLVGSGPFTYSWYFAGTNLLQSGANNSFTLVNAAMTNAGLYKVVVANNYGSVTTRSATLILGLSPSLTLQPLSQTNSPGAPLTFSVVAGGTGPFSYQWQFNGLDVPGLLTTVAGTNATAWSGDGGPATNAALHDPHAILFDTVGNLFIADTHNNRIRKVDTNGIITTLAGNGQAAFAGDSGQATSASLYYPYGLARHSSGKLYIGDSSNGRVRMVSTNGIITTVAGNSSQGSSGDGFIATVATLTEPWGVAFDAVGNWYIADHTAHRIRKVDTNGFISTVAGNGNATYVGDGGPATAASLKNPCSVTLDRLGNLYIADSGNNRIRKVDTYGTINTVAGNGNTNYSGDGGLATSAGLSGPSDMAFDASGNLYIAEQNGNRIRKVAATGIITTALGDGTAGFSGDGSVALNARFNAPCNIAFDPSGNLYVADQSNQRIRKILSGPSWSLPSVKATNSGDYRVIVSSLYGSVTSLVATLSVTPEITRQPVSQFALVGSNASFSVAATSSGPPTYDWFFAGTNLLQSGTSSTLTLAGVMLTNTGDYTVVVRNDCGSTTSQVATLKVGLAPSIASQPSSQTNAPGTPMSLSVAANGTGPFTYQWQFNGTNVPGLITTVVGSGTTGYWGDGGQATNAALYAPQAMTFDDFGNLFFADKTNNRIRKVETNGIITTFAGDGSATFAGDGGPATSASLYYLYGLARDAAGRLYIGDNANSRVRLINTNGTISTVAGNGSQGSSGDGGVAINASLWNPWGVAVDAVGNLFIADHQTHRIRKVDGNGIITTVAGSGTNSFGGDGGPAPSAYLRYPSSVAVDFSGNLYIADSNNNRIRKVDTNGIITTVAGNGSTTYSGDGGVATNAGLSGPSDVALDAAGNLYIAEQSGNRIRKVDAKGIITTVAGDGTAGFSGDGNVALNARLSSSSSIAFDSSGSLYIADQGNQRIRRILFGPAWSLPSVGGINAGDYRVVVSSPYGSVTSLVATLSVSPEITRQPVSQITTVGSSVSFSVAATGSAPLGYSWYLAGANLVQCGTNNILTLPIISQRDAGRYTVVVTNLYGAATSQVASLWLPPFSPPTITVQPTAQTNLLGTLTTLNVAADGPGPFTYQWRLNGTNFPSTIITTVAGTNASGYFGDGGNATSAILDTPSGVAFDALGNFFIADTYYQVIRKVNTSGIISTVAGNGFSGYSGDGSAATNSRLNRPYGVACDVSGNLYIADYNNNCIRKVDTNGIISTVAGGGSSLGDGGQATNAILVLPCGVALDVSNNLYIADTYHSRIRKVDTYGIISTVAGGGSSLGDGGQATNASLSFPRGVALDVSKNLYVADNGNNRIRKVDTNGIISTVAGGGSSSSLGDGGAATNAGLRSPWGVAVDAFGGLYLADNGSYRIRKVDQSGIITTVAGTGTNGYSGDGGTATNANLGNATSLTTDSFGNIYICDTGNHRIRKLWRASPWPAMVINQMTPLNTGDYSVVVISPYGSVTSQVATLSVAFPPVVTVQPLSQFAPLGSSPSISVSATSAGPFGYQWYFNGTNLLQNATSDVLTVPSASFADAGNYTVVVTNTWASVTSQVARLALGFPPTVATEPSSQTNMPGASAVFDVLAGGTGPFSYQWQLNGTNLPNNIVTTVAGNGNYGFSVDGGMATNASLSLPAGVALDASGTIYFADQANQRIRKVETSGVITTVAGNGIRAYSGDGGPATNASLYSPWNVLPDAVGNLYIADQINYRVRKVDTNGIITTIAGNGTWASSGDGGAATNASLGAPRGMALDAKGNLYVADNGNNRIRKVDTNGIISTVAGGGSSSSLGDGGLATSASLNGPAGLEFDSSGNLYIADERNNRIRMVNASGIITTVAGNGNAAYSGDGGPASSAGLNSPLSISLDKLGSLYISDHSNNRIRKVDPIGIITTVAGTGIPRYSGDGGTATDACFNSPSGIAQGLHSDLYIVDTGDQRIRKVAALGGNPFLSLTEVSGTNSGNYSVVISSPYGSVTSQVATLTVAYPNTAPILPAIPNFYANVQETLTFTNLATDSDSPTNLLTYTLEPGAPEGAEMDPTNGIFSWTPSRQQAATTNLITMTVTDDGTPPLNDSKSFYVIVSDYAELWVGSKILRVGESGSLPLSFSSSTPVTHLALSLQFAPDHLGNWSIEPTNSTTGNLGITNSNQLLLSFDLPPSLSLTGKVELAQLNFTALAPQQSAFLPLTFTWASALRADDGTEVPRNLFNNNEIVALGQAPLMRAYLSTNAQPYLLLYGQPGTNYTLDYVGSLQAPLLWTPFTSITLTDFTYTFPEMPPTNALRLFRARE